VREQFPSREELAGQLRSPFSSWDLLVIPLILVGLLLLTIAFQGAAAPFGAGSPDLTVTLDPANLPYYGLRTMFRMFLAVLCSLVFTLIVGTLAAKSRRAELVLIPILDFLQSLPILGFLTVTTTIFLGVFRGSLLGLEAAAIFAVFTSQVWNMTFSFYQSLLTTPRELTEAAAALRLSAWQKFWKLEVPFAMPGLVWNTMMSVSGGWFFVVAAEVITVAGRDQPQQLPGVGSYIWLAIQGANVPAMGYAALTLVVLVFVYDQLLFRPIVAWAEQFKFEQSESQDTASSWMLDLLRRARLTRRVVALAGPLLERLSLATSRRDRPGPRAEVAPPVRRRDRLLDRAWMGLVVLAGLALLYVLARFMFGPGLGFADGKPLAPNPNLNSVRTPDLAAQFSAAAVPVGDDQTVYLSDVCAVSEGGTNVSPALASALEAGGVVAPADLPAACAAPLQEAGLVTWPEVLGVARLGLFTAARVITLIVLATLFWTPVGVWIGLRPRLTQIMQPFAQLAAAFPANLLFPIAVVLIAHFALNPNIWLSPLMVLGTQWYILFNVIAGTVAIPNDLKEAARVTGLRGWPWWRSLALPAIFPAFITGGITASGGSWNASIVAEVASWGSTTLVAAGLGAYISRWSTGVFNPHVALGMLGMGVIVLIFNRLLWRRLYRLAEARFRLD
jgi:NitT/TauT family transport system permease protein